MIVAGADRHRYDAGGRSALTRRLEQLDRRRLIGGAYVDLVHAGIGVDVAGVVEEMDGEFAVSQQRNFHPQPPVLFDPAGESLVFQLQEALGYGHGGADLNSASVNCGESRSACFCTIDSLPPPRYAG